VKSSCLAKWPILSGPDSGTFTQRHLSIIVPGIARAGVLVISIDV
jgi:hypothetical protein